MEFKYGFFLKNMLYIASKMNENALLIHAHFSRLLQIGLMMFDVCC